MSKRIASAATIRQATEKQQLAAIREQAASLGMGRQMIIEDTAVDAFVPIEDFVGLADFCRLVGTRLTQEEVTYAIDAATDAFRGALTAQLGEALNEASEE